MKQTRSWPLPPDIEENRNASTRLEALHLTQRTGRELRNSGFVTAGQVASRSAGELKAFCYLTPAMLAEIEEALHRLELALRLIFFHRATTPTRSHRNQC